MASLEMKWVTRHLSAGERLGEILFGLIMVLSITGSLSASSSGHNELRTMLIAALGYVSDQLPLIGAMLARAQVLERQLALIVLVVFRSRLVIGQHSLGLAWPPPPPGKNKSRLG